MHASKRTQNDFISSYALHEKGKRLFQKVGEPIQRGIEPQLPWLDRKYGQVGFYLAQAVLGHGCLFA